VEGEIREAKGKKRFVSRFVIVSLGVEVEPFGDELFNFADSVEVCGVVVSFVEILFAAKFVV